MSDAMSTLFKSRKFWLSILDAGLSSLAVILALIFKPEIVDKILAMVALWQPVIIAVIVSITVQNVEGIKADGTLAEARAWAINHATPEGASSRELDQR